MRGWPNAGCAGPGWCELNSAEGEAEGVRERADHQRFGKPRDTLKQTMSPTEKSDQKLVNYVVLADDYLRELTENLFSCLGQLLDGFMLRTVHAVAFRLPR